MSSSPTEIKTDPKPKRASRRPKGVVKRRLRKASGETVTIRTVDANSPTFGEDFLYVFAQNVKAARKENKVILGTPSGVKKPR